MSRSGPRHPLLELTKARLLEFVREPSAIFWVFGFPVLLAIGLGIAFRSQPMQSYKVGVLGEGQEVTRTLTILKKVKQVDAVKMTPKKAALGLRKGKLDLLLTPGAASTGALQFNYRYDATRPQSRTARLAVNDILQRALGRIDPALVKEKVSTEPGGRYIDFLMPGLIGLNVMSSGMWGIGYAVVLARRRRLLKRLAATPMRRSHFLFSFMISRLLFLAAEITLLVLFGWLVFDVALHGSFIGLCLTGLMGGLSFIGIALLVAARPDSTEVASGWMNAVMLPMWILSGSFFSYERFPEVIHPIIKALPLTAFNDAFRAVMNDGATLWAIWPQLLILTCWCLVTFTLALRWFRWQ